MQLPYPGLTTIIEDLDGIKMITPAKRNAGITAFLGLWLCGWAFGEIFVSVQLLSGGSKGAPDGFSLIWICGWTIGGVVALRSFWWMVFGKEVVTAGQGTITIAKRGALLIKPKTYDLREAKNFRIQISDEGYQDTWGRRRGNGLSIADAGTISFDYGMQTVKFAEGVDEAEAAFLLKKLRDKKILSDRNFEPVKTTI